jgi:hypothetical protein
MSQQNVELLLAISPGRDVDLVRMFRDESRWAALVEAAAPFYHAEFETAVTVLGIAKAGRGMAGMRTLWLDWLGPWAEYRTEVEDIIDCGERVLVLNHSFGRLEDGTQEVREAPSAVWTIHDQKIARAEFYTAHAEGLEAVGRGSQGM